MTPPPARGGLDDAVRAELQARAPAVLTAIAAVRARRITYLGPRPLADLATAVLDVERAQTPGIIVEAGTAMGGSAIVLASAKAQTRALRLYDLFGMIPPPSERDGADVQDRYQRIASGQSPGIGGDLYYGYHADLVGEVSASFSELGYDPAEHHITLIRGLFQDTIQVDEPIALAHLDGDWYESTKVCLDRFVPQLVVGGRLIIDDYDQWSGCRTAVDEFLASPTGRTGFATERHARLHLVRTG